MSGHQSIIASMSQDSLQELKELLREEEIQIIKTPQTGLLMMVAQDPFATDFCLGEIMITEAETAYQSRRGYAMVMGDEPEKALLAAAVAAIFQSEDDVLKNKIDRFLAPLISDLQQKSEWERKLLAKTLVNFETMVKG